MTPDELKRRCAALSASPTENRPVSILQLEKIAGLADHSIIKYSRGQTERAGKVYLRLDRAFRLLENGQIGPIRKSVGLYGVVFGLIEKPPSPPQAIISQVQMTKQGLRVAFTRTNPNAFTPLPEVIIDRTAGKGIG